jgi:hypothetical protein
MRIDEYQREFVMNKRETVLILTMAGLLAACNDARTATDQDEKQIDEDLAGEVRLQPDPNVITELTLGKRAPGDQITVGPGLQRLVDLATKDLIAKEGIEATQVEVLQAAYVSWPDSSMGCPQPGHQYLQVVTNGSRIVLKADKQVYYYHSGENKPPFPCVKPSPSKPLPYGPGEA